MRTVSSMPDHKHAQRKDKPCTIGYTYTDSTAGFVYRVMTGLG